MSSLRAARLLSAAMLGAALAEPALAQPPSAPASACKLTQIGELPIRYADGQLLIEGQINDRKVWMVADTGASKTVLFRDAVFRLGLRAKDADGVEFYGVGGTSRAQVITLKTLKLGQYELKNATLFVVGERPSGDGDVVGLLGRDFFSRVEIEFDLKAGVVRLIRADNCRNADLAYWSKDFSIALLRQPDQGAYWIDVKLNGKTVAAEVDSGSSRSFVTSEAASLVGVSPQTAPPSEAATGIGGRIAPAFTATFGKLEIGEETVTNVKLRVANLFRGAESRKLGSHIDRLPDDTPGLLLGADFLRAHRVLLSSSQHRMYFTYNGGPIFQPADGPTPAPKPSPAEAKAQPTPSGG